MGKDICRFDANGKSVEDAVNDDDDEDAYDDSVAHQHYWRSLHQAEESQREPALSFSSILNVSSILNNSSILIVSSILDVSSILNVSSICFLLVSSSNQTKIKHLLFKHTL